LWLWLVAVLACSACRTYGRDALPDKPLDLPGLIDALRASGATVQSGEAVEQPFFTVPGRFVHVNGQDVQVFQHPDAAGAQREPGLVSPDGGTVGGSAIMWAAPPHFYRKGRLIVLYVGDDSSVESVLQLVLGLQFAGR
jgi:hypothetical protein